MEKKLNILVVDNEDSIRNLFRKVLLRKGYDVETAKSGQEAIVCLEKQEYQIVLLDVRMPGTDGLEVLKIIKSNYPKIEVIMITGHGSMRMAQECLQSGAYDFLTKPVEINDLCDTIERLSKYIKSFDYNEPSYTEISRKYDVPIARESQSIKSVLSLLERIDSTSSNVLIQGETGSGKELVARRIHKGSPRKNKPFIVINCAALPDNLLESELFGYEAGAFTDAFKTKRGLLEVANGGTLFLDEVAELSRSLQSKLLRVVETGEFRRLGSNKEIHVDVRIISATNKDLTKEISAHRFREDLFYRLGVLSINMPPLRERKEDIPLLVNYFLKNSSIQKAKRVKEISRECLEKLKEYNWPGNIREMHNVVERMVILTDKECLETTDLPNFIQQAETVAQENLSVEKERTLTLSEQEKEYIYKILEETRGNRSKAAKILGITRSTLINKIKHYGIKEIVLDRRTNN